MGISALRLHPVQEGHRLHAGAGEVGGEGRRRGAERHARLGGPEDSVGIEAVGRDVPKRAFILIPGLIERPPQEGHDLGAGAGLVRAEVRLVGIGKWLVKMGTRP